MGRPLRRIALGRSKHHRRALLSARLEVYRRVVVLGRWFVGTRRWRLDNGLDRASFVPQLPCRIRCCCGGGVTLCRVAVACQARLAADVCVHSASCVRRP